MTQRLCTAVLAVLLVATLSLDAHAQLSGRGVQVGVSAGPTFHVDDYDDGGLMLQLDLQVGASLRAGARGLRHAPAAASGALGRRAADGGVGVRGTAGYEENDTWPPPPAPGGDGQLRAADLLAGKRLAHAQDGDFEHDGTLYLLLDVVYAVPSASRLHAQVFAGAGGAYAFGGDAGENRAGLEAQFVPVLTAGGDVFYTLTDRLALRVQGRLLALLADEVDYTFGDETVTSDVEPIRIFSTTAGLVIRL